MNKPFRGARYLVLDTETTGMNADTDAIVEVAGTWVVLEPTVRIEPAFDRLVNPQRPIPALASAVHHLTDSDVADAPTWDAVWRTVVQPALDQADVAVAHNAPFDQKFLPGVDAPWLDTLRAARRCWPDAPAHTNQVLRYWLGLAVEAPHPHRAGDDTRVTAALLVRFLDAVSQKDMSVDATVEDLLDWIAAPLAVAYMPFGKHRGVPLSDLPKDYIHWALNNMTNLDPDLRCSLEQVFKARSQSA